MNAGADIRLFNEGDTSGVYTHELYLSALAVLDRELTASEAAALGSPQARGIYSLAPGELPKLTLTLTNSATLTWQPVSNFRLQRTLDLRTPWQDVPNTTGIGSYSEPRDAGGRTWFRLFRP